MQTDFHFSGTVREKHQQCSKCFKEQQNRPIDDVKQPAEKLDDTGAKRASKRQKVDRTSDSVGVTQMMRHTIKSTGNDDSQAHLSSVNGHNSFISKILEQTLSDVSALPTITRQSDQDRSATDTSNAKSAVRQLHPLLLAKRVMSEPRYEPPSTSFGSEKASPKKKIKYETYMKNIKLQSKIPHQMLADKIPLHTPLPSPQSYFSTTTFDNPLGQSHSEAKRNDHLIPLHSRSEKPHLPLNSNLGTSSATFSQTGSPAVVKVSRKIPDSQKAYINTSTNGSPRDLKNTQSINLRVNMDVDLHVDLNERDSNQMTPHGQPNTPLNLKKEIKQELTHSLYSTHPERSRALEHEERPQSQKSSLIKVEAKESFPNSLNDYNLVETFKLVREAQAKRAQEARSQAPPPPKSPILKRVLACDIPSVKFRRMVSQGAFTDHALLAKSLQKSVRDPVHSTSPSITSGKSYCKTGGFGASIKSKKDIQVRVETVRKKRPRSDSGSNLMESNMSSGSDINKSQNQSRSHLEMTLRKVQKQLKLLKLEHEAELESLKRQMKEQPREYTKSADKNVELQAKTERQKLAHKYPTTSLPAQSIELSPSPLRKTHPRDQAVAKKAFHDAATETDSTSLLEKAASSSTSAELSALRDQNATLKQELAALKEKFGDNFIAGPSHSFVHRHLFDAAPELRPFDAEAKKQEIGQSPSRKTTFGELRVRRRIPRKINY